MSLAASIPPRYSINDYRHWQGDWELINGYPYAMSPSPYSQHQLMASSFEFTFQMSLREKKSHCKCQIFHELDWIINEENIVRPDVAIVCVPVEKKGFITHPPVLIVEVFSDASRMKDRNLKFRLYESAGVKYYLMGDPDTGEIEVFELIDNQYKEVHNPEIFYLHKGCELNIDLGDIPQS
jgi:Uma2 family endonuclease